MIIKTVSCLLHFYFKCYVLQMYCEKIASLFANGATSLQISLLSNTLWKLILYPYSPSQSHETDLLKGIDNF
jgi:hypothetical protein